MKKLLFMCVLIASLVFGIAQKRKFYHFENRYFTVWKTWGGVCYITPYKYWGIVPPKNNYITGPNWGGISISIINDTTFIYYGSYREEAHPFDFYLQDYSYIFVDMNDTTPEGIEKYQEIEKTYPSKEYSFIDIDIKENHAAVYHPGKGRKILR